MYSVQIRGGIRIDKSRDVFDVQVEDPRLQ